MPERHDLEVRARRRLVVARVVLVLAIGIQVWGLYAPDVPSGGGLPGADKVAHAGMFALVMAAGVAAGVPARPLAAVLVAHAVASESIQAVLISTRAGDVLDALADVVGVGVGWHVGRPFAPRPRRPLPPIGPRRAAPTAPPG
ncbi:hypothetical protein [Agrococcus sp. SGAir0287]|uniref:hypothetical protein n=1 Tax=Agrococcus sp. SGAir0287 TaxID=2070347 RepID=UPI0010CD49D3|nr:hypothetical protein [Agrococcus sp. SGAir0287]QCR18338.1 hypothetical protein C1N71_01780 [Agrococcus sp. SGAir0287]